MPEAPQQNTPALPGFEEVASSIGLDTDALPHGAGVLKKRELQFALAYLRTGNATRAADEAGYSDPSGNAAKLLKRTDILRFITPALKQVSQNADQLIARVYKRSVDLHAQWEELRARELRDWKKEREVLASAKEQDDLLGKLLGRVQTSVHVTGAIEHNHSGSMEVAIPASALPALAQMRRDVVQARLAQPLDSLNAPIHTPLAEMAGGQLMGGRS